MKKLIPALLALTLLFTACDKGSDPTPPATVTFQPTTAGSTWTYETKNNVPAVPTKSTFTITATGADSTIGGKLYKVFTNTSGGHDYYYNDGTDYYQFGGIAGITENTELLYLKSNIAVGTGWEETKTVNIPGVGSANVKFTYSYFEKNDSMTVAGNTYTDVRDIKVNLPSNITVNINGVPFQVPISGQNLHFYYAPGIGRIRSKIKLTLTPPFVSIPPTDYETSLISSVIK